MTEKNEARVRTRAPMVPIGAKTLLSLLMAVVMLVGLLPVTALAAEDTRPAPDRVQSYIAAPGFTATALNPNQAKFTWVEITSNSSSDLGKERSMTATVKCVTVDAAIAQKIGYNGGNATVNSEDLLNQLKNKLKASKDYYRPSKNTLSFGSSSNGLRHQDIGKGTFRYLLSVEAYFNGTYYFDGAGINFETRFREAYRGEDKYTVSAQVCGMTIYPDTASGVGDPPTKLKLVIDNQIGREFTNTNAAPNGNYGIQNYPDTYVANFRWMLMPNTNLEIELRNNTVLHVGKYYRTDPNSAVIKTNIYVDNLTISGNGVLLASNFDNRAYGAQGTAADSAIHANSLTVDSSNVVLDLTRDGSYNCIEVPEPSAFKPIDAKSIKLAAANGSWIKGLSNDETSLKNAYSAYWDTFTTGVTGEGSSRLSTVTFGRTAMSTAAQLTVGDNAPVQSNVTIPNVTVNGGETVAVKASVELPTWLSNMYTDGRVKLGNSGTLRIYKGSSLSASNKLTDITVPDDLSGSVVSYSTSFTPEAGKTYTVYACIPIVTENGGKQLGSASVIATIKAVEKKSEITSVNLTGDALTEGAASGPNLTSSDTSYTFTQSAWNPSGSVAAGKEYYTTLTLTANDGYVFPTDWTQLRDRISVKLGDKTITKLGLGLANGGKTLSLTVYATADHNHNWGAWEKDEDSHYRTCSSCQTVSNKVTHDWNDWTNSDENTEKRTCGTCGYEETRARPERPISFLKINIIRPVAGATPSASDLTIRDAYVDQVDIVANSVGWYDESGNPVTGNFEKGKSYTIKAQFQPIGDRTFADTIIGPGVGSFYLPSETKTLSENHKTIDYSCTFKAYESTTVDTALPTLVIGEAMPLPTVPEGREYSVTVMYSTGAGSLSLLSYDGSKWKDSSDVEVTGDDLKVKAAVYYYSCTIKEGDNEKVTAHLTGTGNSTVSAATGNGVSASYTINAENKITSVDLTVDAPEYGKAPAATATGADNAKYTVGTPIWSPAVTDNKFGAGTYTVSIPVTVTAGYSFAESCIYTVNGYSATYADGKVSYTFPALTAPHSHTYDDTWTPLDDTNHYRVCTVCGEGMEIAEHSFGDWTPDTADATRHYKECSVCGHKVYGSHEESARITDTAAGIGTDGAWHTKCEVCGKTMNSGTIAALEKIDKAEVTVTAPVRNAAPTNAAVKDTETRYYVASTEWEPVVTDKFASGTKYTVKVTLEANDGYAFKGDGIFGIGDTTFTINGKKAKVVSGDAQQVVITYEFPATGSGSYNGGTGSGGTTNKPVKSPSTGDPGVMLYAAMGLLSLSGGAWIVGRKRKDK